MPVDAAGPADHFLRQGETLAGITGLLRLAEQVECGQAQRFARLVGEAATDDQVDTAAGAHFVQQHVGLEFELAQHLAGLGLRILPS